jgi:hypothetical protein
MPRRVGREIKGPVVTTGNPDSVNDTPVTLTTVGSAYDLSGQLGAIYRTPDGLSEYIYVRFSSTSTGKTPTSNQICYWWSSTSTSTTNAYQWTVDNQTSAGNSNKLSQIAGILRCTPTRGNYVWLLRRSPSCNVVSTATGFITGNAVIATTASGEAAYIASTSTAAPAAGIGASDWFLGRPIIGYVNSTTTSSVAIDTALDIE